MRKKSEDLHTVEHKEDITDEVIDQVMAELREEDGIQQEIDEQVRLHRKNRRKRMIIAAAVILAILTASFLVIYLRTYTSSRVTASYEIKGESTVSYQEFAGGVLKYSRDGIALISRKGEEKWNQSYQMSEPMVSTWQDETAVVADKGGNTIMVVDKDGLKGEMQTTLPVEKVAVSAQGIVCAVLKSDPTPKIICYDAEGNILAELATSLTGTGYPLDVSISEDGKLLLASYLSVQDGQLVTRVKYYSFSGKKEKSQDYEAVSDDYPGMAAASAFFMDGDTSVVAGDNKLLIYTGSSKPELAKTIGLKKKIRSVFHSDRYIGLVLINNDNSGYELRLYNKSGSQVLSETISEAYANVKISGSQVLMYDGRKCSVYTRNGIHRFEGELDSNILEIFPVLGVNKYIVMCADGMEVVRFVK